MWRDFEGCKSRMLLRYQQSFRFWTQLPWAVLGLAECLLHDTADALARCQQRAIALINHYDSVRGTATGPAKLGNVSHIFFDAASPLRPLIEVFAATGRMGKPLQIELIKYSTALTAMARLESKHHLVNMSLTTGPASLPALVAANMRRRQNRDVNDVRFLATFAGLAWNLDKLVAEPWDCRNDLLKLVYGFKDDVLHKDASQLNNIMLKFREQLALTAGMSSHRHGRLHVMKNQHVQQCLVPGNFYALQRTSAGGDESHFLVFQATHMNPGGRK